MNPLGVALSVGAMVVLGKWARDQSPGVDNAIGVAGLAIGLTIIEEMNEKLAAAFGVLVFVSVAIVHFPAIAKAAGLNK